MSTGRGEHMQLMGDTQRSTAGTCRPTWQHMLTTCTAACTPPAGRADREAFKPNGMITHDSWHLSTHGRPNPGTQNSQLHGTQVASCCINRGCCCCCCCVCWLLSAFGSAADPSIPLQPLATWACRTAAGTCLCCSMAA